MFLSKRDMRPAQKPTKTLKMRTKFLLDIWRYRQIKNLCSSVFFLAGIYEYSRFRLKVIKNPAFGGMFYFINLVLYLIPLVVPDQYWQEHLSLRLDHYYFLGKQ